MHALCVLPPKVVPWNHDIESEQGWYDGLFISNGPGDPEMARATIETLRAFIAPGGIRGRVFPIFGICLGNQV